MSRQPFPDYLDVDYDAGAGESPEDYPGTAHKIETAIEVVREGLEQYRNPAVMWTGGKDSTLTLYLVNEVIEEYDMETPPTVFIDHFQHFDDLMAFVDRWADRWDLEVIFARNEDVGDYVEANDLDPGDDIPVDIHCLQPIYIAGVLLDDGDWFGYYLRTIIDIQDRQSQTQVISTSVSIIDLHGHIVSANLFIRRFPSDLSSVRIDAHAARFFSQRINEWIIIYIMSLDEEAVNCIFFCVRQRLFVDNRCIVDVLYSDGIRLGI